MKKIYLLIVCVLMLSAAKTNAQCSVSGRYSSYMFSGYTTTNVSYTNSSDAGMIAADSMTIYQPSGDVYTNRPVIIMAHGGSFIGGSRKLDTSAATPPSTTISSVSDPAVDTICLRFVKRGYVTVSIDYRLAGGGVFPADVLQMATGGFASGSAAYAVAAAISDGKAAMRYLCAHASTYGIDTTNMFIGGNSAGAVMFMHIGYLDSVGECTPLMLGALNNNGGFNGNSGYGNYTPKAKAIINLAGALASVNIASAGNIPSVNCQGDLDATVPYTCAKALSGQCPDTLCGLGSLAPQYTAAGITHWDMIFPGQGHVPWDGNDTMMNSVDSLVNAFLYGNVCGGLTSVNNVPTISDVSVYPNPATDLLNIHSSDFVRTIVMYDQMGRVVMSAEGINKGSYQFNTSRLAKGIYFVKITFNNESNAPMIKQVAIQ